MIAATDGRQNQTRLDVLIVGAGPVGLACGIEAKQRHLAFRILEKGCLTNSIFNFPKHMTWFSTPELLEIGDVPLIASGGKPTRQDTLNYYRRVLEHFDLSVTLYEKVERVVPSTDGFEVVTTKSSYWARSVVLAIGFFDHPNFLDVPGEELAKVSHYYTEPFPFFKRKVAVIGGRNSAVEAALDLYRHGAEVTLIHRRSEIREGVKYWILPDILNRIKEGSIKALFNSRVTRITEEEIFIDSDSGDRHTLQNDFVFALTGYHPDHEFMKAIGIDIDARSERPQYHPETFETNVPGLYVAGIAAAGKDRNMVFIEHGREHARRIIADVATKLAHWHTLEAVVVG